MTTERNPSSEDKAILAEASEYYCTITPRLEQGRIFFNVTEWHNPSGEQHGSPRGMTNVVGVDSEKAAQAAVNHLRAAREQFIRLRRKYEGMVL